ncbi:MAG: hypothetical protein AB1452_00705 [Pseudomonadota bacterium]
MKRTFLLPLLLPLTALAYDVNGVGLGGKEADVRKAFPSAHCRPLEWRTDAAERRCDDARIPLGGVEAKVTFYLKADVIRAYDLRFAMKDLEKVKIFLRARWGAPLAEATEVIARRNSKDERKVFKMRWEKGVDHALLSAQLEKKRANVEVGRGNFFEEVYRVK